MQKPALTQERAQAYWQRTSTLMWTILAIWFFFSFVIHFFAPQLNKIVIFGFPLGFYMAAQGSLISSSSCASGTPAPRTRSTRNSAWPRTEGRSKWQRSRKGRFHRQSRQDLRDLHRRIHRLHDHAGHSRVARACRTRIIGYLFIFMTIGVYALIGVLSRTSEVSEYYVAGRARPGLLQRHGDRRRLDERRLVHLMAGGALLRRL